MQCEQTHLLQTYHDRELAPDRAEAMQWHVQTCAACRAELERLRMLSEFIQGAQRPKLSDQAIQRLKGSYTAIEEQGVIRLAERLTIAAAVLLALGLAGLSVENGWAGPNTAWEQTAVTLDPDVKPAIAATDLVVAEWAASGTVPMQGGDLE